MNIQKLSVGPYEVNCAIVWGEEKQALIIDPGYDIADIEAVLKENDLTVAAILLTHGHADHISALIQLHTAHPAPIYLHPEDVKWAFGENNQILPHYPIPIKPDVEFLDPTTAPASYGFQCVETPGHTPGGICYWFENEAVCFTGDTLFRGSCGRTDLPGGDSRILSASLKKLAQLPPETRIIAGHGLDSTIGHENQTNFFMQQANR